MISTLLLSAALSAPCPVGQLHAARVLRVVDGDTLDALIDLDLEVRVEARIRLLGVDTPELRAKGEVERARAVAAKVYVMDAVGGAVSWVAICTAGRDSFGRVLADVWIGDRSLSLELIERGLGRAWP